MLKYIEKSTNDNVTNQDIASIQELVTKVRHKKEVGVNYMKSWEIEEMMRHQGFREGFNDGFNDGNRKGIEQGIDKLSQLIIKLTEAGRTDDKEKQHPDHFSECCFCLFHAFLNQE